MKAVLYFPGCRLPVDLPAADRAVRALMPALGISLEEAPFSCCGYPLRDTEPEASVFSAARNIALAGSRNRTLMPVCKCGYGQLMYADACLTQNENLRNRINDLLREEDLEWRPGVEIRHIFSVLDEDIGAEDIRERVVRPLTGTTAATHYGCHALRPADIMRMDNPAAPQIMERLLTAIGAEITEYPRRLDCCGHPAEKRNPDLARAFARRKRRAVKSAGADLLVTGCTFCQIHLANHRGMGPDENNRIALTDNGGRNPEVRFLVELVAEALALVPA